MFTKRVVITAGGTGGHLYPAQALAQQLKKQTSSEILFIAGGLKTNRYFDRNSFSFQEIACSPLFSRNPLKGFKGIVNLFRGFKQSLAILKQFHPDVVVGFGSYYTVPILLAARYLKIPIVLHEANSIPGRANKWLAPLADYVGISFPSTASLFKAKTVMVGLPLREGYQLCAVEKEEALAYYGLSSHNKTLLICGGSQGARTINQLVEKCLPLMQSLSLQIIHLTGDADSTERLSNLYASHHIQAVVKVFESRMQMAWRAADGFVGRAGASTIAESIEFEIPGILIPYPFATDQHQEKNADFLVDNVNSAWKLLEPALTAEKLAQKIEDLFNPEQYNAFKEALKTYKQRPHQLTLCQLIQNMTPSNETCIEISKFKDSSMNDVYHFIGIGGIGMSGLARLLLSQKKKVTGSDIAINANIEELIKEGAVIHKGHAAANIPPHAKVIYSSDIKQDNPEYQAAIQRQCTLLHRADLLAELLKGSKALAVAGTHGKTTTSSLLATVLMDAALDPTFAIGGMLPAYQCNARFGKGEYSVFESDESDRSFLKFHPFGAIVTNIDQDHLNNYEGSFPLLIENFKLFMSQIQSTQHLFWCRDDHPLTQLNFPGQTYGFHANSDWKIISMHQKGFKLYFDLEHQGKIYADIELALAGRHNVLNAAAVFGLALTLGVAENSIRNSFRTFKGVLRRCENKGTCRGVDFVDDYAHHPVEIQTTLEGIRQAVGSKRLIAVFQPHRYSRTQDCLGSYGTIFNAVDELLITDIYGAGEVAIPNLSHALIQQEIEQSSKVSCRYVTRSALSHFLSQFLQPCDVVVTLGAGDITKLSSETLVLLENSQRKASND